MRNAFLLVLIAAGTAPLGAQIEVSPLHPRLFVRADAARIGKGPTVATLRARLKDPAYQRWRRELPERGGAAVVAERAARYLEEGNPADAKAVAEFLGNNTFSYRTHDVSGYMAGGYMATALDMAYHGLSPEERAAAMRNIVTTVDDSSGFVSRGGEVNHNYTYMALTSVALAGLVLKGEPEPFNSKGVEYLEVARSFLESPGKALDTWSAREGAWSEGSHYSIHETIRNVVVMMAAYRGASSRDYFREAERRYGDFLLRTGRFIMASTRPDMTLVRTGDSSPSRVLASHTVVPTIEMLAAGLSDPEEAARLRSFSDAIMAAYGEDAVYPAYHWSMRVFHDPRAPRTPSYHTLPLSMRLGKGTYEQISFRNGWGPDSTLVTILAGDHFTDHQHFDKGQFLIYRRGGLAIDGGTYDGMYKAGAHPGEYAARTLAHNCLLVYDPKEVFPRGYANDGGQRVLSGIQHHRDWPSFIAHRKKEGLDAAEVEAYDYAPGRYHYLRADLSSAYTDKVIYYDRQFVYLPSRDLLVVYDRAGASRPDMKQRWLLHFQDRPEVDGAVPEPGVKAYPGAQLVAMRRGGAAELGGKTFPYDGVLFVRTLLPAAHETTVVGGPGYEYYNAFAGKNYPPSRAALAPPLRETGNWRIEVAPARDRRDEQFLHAIQIAGAADRPVESRRVADAENRLAGLHYFSEGENQVVLFSGGLPGSSVPLPVEYEISSAAPARHLLAELPPGRRISVTVNGKALPPVAVNAQGVAQFQDQAKGSRKITISALDARVVKEVKQP